MSSLAVVFNRDGRPLTHDGVWEMLDAVPYHGPDGVWVRNWNTISMGYAKTTVTPEEIDEQQPLVSPRTGCSIVADIRLDNRTDLRRILGSLPASTSDAELALRAYERWDSDAISHLLGDFAFVIWDPRNQEVVCGRDSSGQRPLFYRVDDRTFAAASEIHQLLQDQSAPVEPNEDRILFGLQTNNIFRNDKQYASTYYRGIYSIPPGHLMIVSSDRHRLKRYWELGPRQEIRYRGDADYAEHFRDLLFTCVKDRLRSIHPVTIALSGGLDSASVACIALELARDNGTPVPDISAVSSIFEGLDCDERPYIETIRAKYGIDVRYVPSNGVNSRLQLEPQRFQESPNMALNDDRAALLAAATAGGARVILTGDVADSCVQGTWLVFDSLLRQGRLRDLRHHAREYQEAVGASRQLIALYTLAPVLPLAMQRRVMAASARRWLARHEGMMLPRWMPEPLRATLEERSAEAAIHAEVTRRFANQTRHYEAHLLDPPEVAGSASPLSLQTWRPFADRRLHEFLLAIPPEQKFNVAPGSGSPYARSKWILRRAMEGILPDTIRLRTMKTNFSQAHSNSIDLQWPLYEAAFGPKGGSEIARRGYVIADQFWSRLEQARAGIAAPDSVYVSHLVGIETWLRAFNLPRAQFVTIPTPTHATMKTDRGATTVFDRAAAPVI